MDRYIFLIIFFLLIGTRCLEKRSGTEFDLNHCDFWRNWNFTNDSALQFDSDEFISRGLTHKCYFFNHTVESDVYNINSTEMNFKPHFWLNEKVFHYNDVDVRNIFMGRKNTITLKENSMSRTYWQKRIVVYDLLNCFTKFNHYRIRISWFYLAKYLSRPKYYSLNIVSSTSKPKTSLFIILLLFMCGDTGASINPGPGTEFGYCDEIIRYNSRSLTCQYCNMKVHLKCNNFSESSHFSCNLCTYNFLPFSLYEDNIPVNNDIHTANNNNDNNNNDNNNNNYNNNPLNKLTNANWECFKKKGLHFIHANARSIFHKLPELELISKNTNAAIIALQKHG